MARWDKKFPLSKSGKQQLWRTRLQRLSTVLPVYETRQPANETDQQSEQWARLMMAARRAAE